MARKGCSVCQHPQIDAINRALARPGVSSQSVAEAFGINRKTLWRHYDKCVKRVVTKALEKQEVALGAGMIAEVSEKREMLSHSMSQSVVNSQHKQLADTASVWLRFTETIAKLAGLDGYRPAQSVTNVDARGSRILIMPQGDDPLALPPASDE